MLGSTYLRRSCGHRFSDSKVKVNILKQSCVLPESVHDFGDLDFVNFGFGEVGFQNLAFTLSKDVRSHTFPIVGKTINKFLHACHFWLGFQLLALQGLIRLEITVCIQTMGISLFSHTVAISPTVQPLFFSAHDL
jgi:hypothetical protein